MASCQHRQCWPTITRQYSKIYKESFHLKENKNCSYIKERTETKIHAHYNEDNNHHPHQAEYSILAITWHLNDIVTAQPLKQT